MNREKGEKGSKGGRFQGKREGMEEKKKRERKYDFIEMGKRKSGLERGQDH